MDQPTRTCTGCHHTYPISQFRPHRASNPPRLTRQCLTCRLNHRIATRRIRAAARQERAAIMRILSQRSAAAAAAATSTTNTSTDLPTLPQLPSELTCLDCCRERSISEFQPVRATGGLTNQCISCRLRNGRRRRRRRRQG
ncbi:hypothetical protein N7493_009728 [Penicillium malachiteum]|uniref:Uncharacterized protein n=1 Tax=Penicillium malachiteum TaxID=1324776 RepID=A0AAD6MSN9_9EURO|nr:hypothetical protein N7493_009728 [Penicillium malachiteum]